MLHEDKYVDIEVFANHALIYLSNGIISKYAGWWFCVAVAWGLMQICSDFIFWIGKHIEIILTAVIFRLQEDIMKDAFGSAVEVWHANQMPVLWNELLFNLSPKGFTIDLCNREASYFLSPAVY